LKVYMRPNKYWKSLEKEFEKVKVKW
jgi:hypothetical protein